ncbi:phage portal protein [Bacillus pumilus]|uniref:phage portal protein n=1 Tax=Bacillus pumilus TaxID=1408 RepID=UPI00204149BE|nr:phage portal protein [Bacillus pumilus]MCM3148467.1 phage portal protein [Bacillus pumilus]
MKILVLKTDYLLSKDAKDALREVAKKAAQTGIMILDGGLDAEVLDVQGVAINEEVTETLH